MTKLETAQIELLSNVLAMYARGHDDMGKEARKALRATTPKRKRKAAR